MSRRWFKFSKESQLEVKITKEKILSVMEVGKPYTTENILDAMYEMQKIDEENKNYLRDTKKLIKSLHKIPDVHSFDIYHIRFKTENYLKKHGRVQESYS